MPDIIKNFIYCSKYQALKPKTETDSIIIFALLATFCFNLLLNKNNNPTVNPSKAFSINVAGA